LFHGAIDLFEHEGTATKTKSPAACGGRASMAKFRVWRLRASPD
jgi:hypothetical protein